MDGPLDPAIYDSARHQPSWWEASAGPAPERTPLAGETAADVAIIGGGVTGLSAARRLAERGLDAVVLDAGAIGWGSSGRAGGIVGFGGSKLSRTALVRRFGEGEVARAEATLADHIRALRQFCLETGLADQVQGEGELVLAHSPKALAALLAERVPDGASVEPVPASGADDIARFGGLILRPSFGIHPLRLTRRLADAAEAAGARLFPRSEVTLWERAGNGHRLVTPGGAVRAPHVLMATNAFAPERLHPAAAARAVPVISNIAVTRPLSAAERARHPWLDARPAADTRALLSYLRLLPEGRLLYGMRGDMRGSEAGAARMRGRLAARIARALPGLAGAEITHFWRGPVCATMALRPAIGRLPDEPSVAYAYGWHGSGIAMGTLAGRLIGEVLAGAPEETIPPPWRGLPPRVPLPGLRPLYVGAMMAAYGIGDRLS